MTFRFRPHRGGLRQSMSEAVELETMADLERHLGAEPGGLLVTFYADTRGREGRWDSDYIVQPGGPDGYPKGFTDAFPPISPPEPQTFGDLTPEEEAAEYGIEANRLGES